MIVSPHAGFQIDLCSSSAGSFKVGLAEIIVIPFFFAGGGF